MPDSNREAEVLSLDELLNRLTPTQKAYVLDCITAHIAREHQQDQDRTYGNWVKLVGTGPWHLFSGATLAGAAGAIGLKETKLMGVALPPRAVGNRGNCGFESVGRVQCIVQAFSRGEPRNIGTLAESEGVRGGYHA